MEGFVRLKLSRGFPTSHFFKHGFLLFISTTILAHYDVKYTVVFEYDCICIHSMDRSDC